MILVPDFQVGDHVVRWYDRMPDPPRMVSTEEYYRLHPHQNPASKNAPPRFVERASEPDFDVEQYLQLAVTDAAGIYAPQEFIRRYDKYLRVDEDETQDYIESAATLERGPEDEQYWEDWDWLMNNAHLIDDEGTKWLIYQSGDVWLIRADAPEGVWERLEY